jgi:hypothetical protein
LCICMCKSLKLNQESRFKWISRFEALWLLCWYVSLQTQNPHFAAKMIPSTNMRVPRNPRDRTYIVSICWIINADMWCKATSWRGGREQSVYVTSDWTPSHLSIPENRHVVLMPD